MDPRATNCRSTKKTSVSQKQMLQLRPAQLFEKFFCFPVARVNRSKLLLMNEQRRCVKACFQEMGSFVVRPNWDHF
jgi:hypothetical protein